MDVFFHCRDSFRECNSVMFPTVGSTPNITDSHSMYHRKQTFFLLGGILQIHTSWLHLLGIPFPKTNQLAPENQGLEDEHFSFRMACLQGLS